MLLSVVSSVSSTPTSLDRAKTPTDGAGADTQSERRKEHTIARGTIIGRYTVLEHLGSGGMASVYSAYDKQLERIVALKMLRAELEVDEVRTRMLREAQAMARLKHEHVVTVYEVGTFDARIFIAMEYVDGATLSAWSKEPRPWRELLRILEAAGRGLAAAHEAGLVHRDFKPDNVLVGKDGRVLVSDFGIARSHSNSNSSSEPELDQASEGDDRETELRTRTTPRGGVAVSGTLSADIGASTDEDERESQPSGGPQSASRSHTDRLTQEGAVLGTPGFIAPEHLFAGVDDARSDQFSFCVTMYRVLYGKRPYEFRNIVTYCEALQGPPEAPPAKTPIPGWVHEIILRGLQRDPALRFASMNELLDALEHDPSRRFRAWAGGALAVTACVAGLVVYGRHRAELRRQCDEGDALMALSWSAESASKLRTALQQSGNKHAADIAERAIERLDQYAGSWKATYRGVAEATLMHGREEQGVMSRRLRCLERAREQLDAVSDVLANADTSVVQHTLDAVYALPVPASCATIEATNLPTLPGSPDLRARVLECERLVARALALTNAGEVVKAEEVAQHGIAEARAIPYARTEAELLLVDAQSKQQRGDKKAAIQSYLHAFASAQRAADDALAVRAAARMGSMLSSWMQKPEEAERWIIAAEGIADRAGRDDASQAEVLTGRMVVNNWLGRSEKNVEIHDKVIELSRRLYGERDLRVARAISNRSVTLEMLGQSDRSIEDRRAAIDMITALTGPDNPALALDYFNLGVSLSTLHRHAEAKTAFERAFKLQADMPPGALTVNIYEGLADSNLHESPPDVTISVVQKGLDVARTLGNGGMREWGLRLVRAEALAKQGDLPGKANECREVLADQEARGQVLATLPYNPDALTCLGEAELELRQTKSAIKHLERSVSLTTRYVAMELPKARFALAKALRVAGRESKRARELAESARDDLRKTQGGAEDVVEIEKWLEQTAR